MFDHLVILMGMGTSVAHPQNGYSSTVSRSNWNLEMLVFVEGSRKTGVPGEKTLGAGTRTNNKLNPDMASTPGIEPGHIDGKRVLSPLRHPCSPKQN